MAYTTWATHKFYPDARHEVFNETNRDEVTGNSLAGSIKFGSNLKQTLIICDLVRAVPAALLAFSGHFYQMYLLIAD